MGNGKRWSKVRAAFDLLQSKEAQNVAVSLKEIKDVTGWEESTIRTYIAKRLHRTYAEITKYRIDAWQEKRSNWLLQNSKSKRNNQCQSLT